MLKPSLFIAGLLFITLTTKAQLQPRITLEQIAYKFYSTYDISHSDIVVNFEKRGLQWKVRIGKYKGPELVNDSTYLFFDIYSGGFHDLPLKPKTDGGPVDLNRYEVIYQKANFDLHQYFGYDGWYKDVIAELSKKEHLRDDSLYSLARAWSTYAASLLSDRTGYAIGKEIFDLPMSRNCMTAAQRSTYKNIQSNAIRCFQDLAQRNSDYNTPIGKIPIKYADEVMVEFQTYLTYADSFAATFPLTDHLYPPGLIEKAQHFLQLCPPDAILLSFGDNDFYSILYVQQKFKVRTDVHVINESLIGSDRFIYMTTQPQFDSKPISISSSYPEYKGHTNDYLMLKESLNAITFADMLDTLQKGHADHNGVLTLPSREFILRKTSGKTGAIDDDTIHFKAASGYLMKNDWVILEMLNNLKGRKFCSTATMYDGMTPLNRFFIKKDEDFYVY